MHYNVPINKREKSMYVKGRGGNLDKKYDININIFTFSERISLLLYM